MNLFIYVHIPIYSYLFNCYNTSFVLGHSLVSFHRMYIVFIIQPASSSCINDISSFVHRHSSRIPFIWSGVLRHWSAPLLCAGSGDRAPLAKPFVVRFTKPFVKLCEPSTNRLCSSEGRLYIYIYI